MKTVEILTYTLAPGSTDLFQDVMIRFSVPLHRAFGIDVVLSAPSLHGQDAYGLVRVFPDMQIMELKLSDFYASADWREGPREQIVSLIETSSRLVLQLTDDAVEHLRQPQR